MNIIIILLVILILLEIFESRWQKSVTFYGLIKNNYQIYNKNIFLYFLFNPTFFFSIYLSMFFNNFGFLMSSIIVMKFLDISFKLFLLNKIHKDEDITYLVTMDIKCTLFLRYFNVILYPITFLFAIA